MTPKITIAYVTGRADPKWEWFVDSMVKQIPPEDLPLIEFLFIDGLLWAKDIARPDGAAIKFGHSNWHNPARLQQLLDVVGGRFTYRHLPVKPSVFQGPFRLTPRDWFDATAVRNTALITASADHIAFQDDLSCPAPTWWADVKKFMHEKPHSVLEGSYRKLRDMVVENGVIASSTDHPAGHDHREEHGKAGEWAKGYGSWLFGCCFLAPIDLLLLVNGYDPRASGIGAEDSMLGLRIENAGFHEFYYSLGMFSPESEDHHHIEGNLYKREDKGVSPKDKSHALLDLARGSQRCDNDGTGRSISEQRNDYRETGFVSIPSGPTVDWYDGQPLSEFK